MCSLWNGYSCSRTIKYEITLTRAESYISLKTTIKTLALCWIVLILASGMSQYSSGATANDFASTSAAITSAFQSIYAAQKSGGNVSVLVSELNTAVALIQKAQTENSTNPTQAVIELQNASNIARQVVSQSQVIAQTGKSAKQIEYTESIGAAAIIVVAAIFIYIYGGRIYRRFWFAVYRNFVVKPKSG